LLPFLPDLDKHVAELTAKDRANTPSIVGIATLLRYLVTVVVQDALEIAESAPLNPVHKVLLADPTFMYVYIIINC
jgi:hypothetical protein